MSSSRKIVAGAGTLALIGQYAIAGNPVTLAATAVALPYVLGGVVVVSTAYTAGKYLENRR